MKDAKGNSYLRSTGILVPSEVMSQKDELKMLKNIGDKAIELTPEQAAAAHTNSGRHTHQGDGLLVPDFDDTPQY